MLRAKVGGVTSTAFRAVKRSKTRDAVGDTDLLVGFKHSRWAAQDLKPEISIRERKHRPQIVGANQPVVLENEFAVEHVTGLHIWQRYG